MAAIAIQQGESPFATQAVTVAAGAVQVDGAAMPSAGMGANERAVDWKDLHTRLVELFESSEDATRKPREYAERDVDYFDNKQWTEREASKLRKRGQPVQMKNMIRQKVKYLQGLEQQQRTDPRALPRTPTHDFDANDCTDALRFVIDANRYDQVRSSMWWDLVVAGWGGYSITVENQPPFANPRIIVRRCRWDRMFWDPYSSAIDYSDATYRGEVLWMDRDQAVRAYGEGAGKVFDETVTSTYGQTYDDKPRTTTWVMSGKRNRVRVVKMYYLGDDGKWQFCEFTKGGYLKAAVSPWLDENGVPEDEYVWRSAYIDRDNNRYGDIRELIDTQDGINKRSSKLLHLGSVRQTFANDGALGNQTADEFRDQAAKPDGHFQGTGEYQFGKDFGIVPTSDLAKGQADMLMLDMQLMETQGPNAAMLGAGSKDASGRAVLANQAGGALATSPLLDTHKDADHEVYRKIWKRIRQFWNAEEWVRVTDDKNAVRWVGFNTPLMADPMSGQPIDGRPQPGQPAQPMLDPATGQPMMRNQVGSLDIDIVIDDAPSVGVLQQEEFSNLVDLAKTGFPVSPRTIIQASSFRSKPKMLEDLDKAEEAQKNQPDPEAQKAQAEFALEQQKAQQQAQAEQAKMAAQIQLKREEAAIEQQKAAAMLQMEREKLNAQLQFEAQKHAQEMQFAREKFALDQASREQTAAIRASQMQTSETRQ